MADQLVEMLRMYIENTDEKLNILKNYHNDMNARMTVVEGRVENLGNTVFPKDKDSVYICEPDYVKDMDDHCDMTDRSLEMIEEDITNCYEDTIQYLKQGNIKAAKGMAGDIQKLCNEWWNVSNENKE